MKYFVLFNFMILNNLAAAGPASCEESYQAELKLIASKVDYQSKVGDQIYVNPHNGGLSYNPGMTLTTQGENWARDFLYAIKYGPEISFGSSKKNRKEVLKSFSKALSKKCKLKADPEFENLRSYLTTLLENKEFCPEGKILEPSFFGSYKKFHQVALKNFSESDEFKLCDDLVIKDDSSRSVKESHSPASRKSKESGARKN